MLFGRLATGGLYLSYSPLIYAIAITIPRFSEEAQENDLLLIRSSDEIEIDDLVLASAYLFSDQSSFELAIKDPAWHQYDQADPSSYWSTGNRDVQNLNATVATYAYTADNLKRRGDDGSVAIDDGKQKHKYLGLLALIPVAAIGAGAYGYHIGHKQYTLKHGKPTGVNIAAPWTPTNVHPPDILKPGKLGEVITNCGGALGPGDLPRPPAEPPIKVPVPPQEINVPKPPQALPPQGPKPVQPEQPETNDQAKTSDQPKTGDQPKHGDQPKTGDQTTPGDTSKPGKPGKPVDPPSNPVEAKPVEPVKPPVEGDSLPHGKPPVTEPKPPNIMDDHVPTGPPERPPPDPPRAPKPKRPFDQPPAKPVEPQKYPPRQRPKNYPWRNIDELREARKAEKVQEKLEEIKKINDQDEKAKQIAEQQRKLAEERKETEQLREQQKKFADEEAERVRKAREEAERLAEQERKATEQAKHAKEVEDRITNEAEELERKRKADWDKFLEDRKAEDMRDAEENFRQEKLKKQEFREAKKAEDLKKMKAKEAARNSQTHADEIGESSKKATQHADRVAEEAKTHQKKVNELFEGFDDLADRADDELKRIKKEFPHIDNKDKKLNEKIDDLDTDDLDTDDLDTDDLDTDENTNSDQDRPKDKQPKHEKPEQEAPKDKPPKQEPPKQEPPKQEPPKQEPLKQEPPKQEPPKNEPPKQEPPKEGSAPKEGQPKQPPKEGSPKPPPNEGSPKPPPNEGSPKPPPNEGSPKPPKVNDGGVPKPPKDGGKLPNTRHNPKHPPQFPHQEGKPHHWDVKFDDRLNRPIDNLAAGDNNLYEQGAVADREHGFGLDKPKHGPEYHAHDVPDGPKPKGQGDLRHTGIDLKKPDPYAKPPANAPQPQGPGQAGLRPTGNHMDLAADSTNSDIPTTLTEAEARQLNEELGPATNGAFDGASDVAEASTEQKVGRIGKEVDSAVDGAFDDAAEQTGKKVKKVWMTFKGRAKDVKNGAVKAWQSVTQVWSEMFRPFKWAWEHVVVWGKKLWGLMTGKVVGNSVFAKVGKCFGTFLKKFTQSRAWKAVARSGLFKFCKKWGPKILARTSRFAGKLASVAGWVMLVQDIKDVAQTSACIGLAFEHKDGPEKMPTFCDGDATKALIKWALTQAGEGAAAAAMFQENEYVEQDNVVTDDSAWSIEEEKDPEAARENWRDGKLIYPPHLSV